DSVPHARTRTEEASLAKRSHATRRVELNAIGINRILTLMLGISMACLLASETIAQASQPASPLSRQDVDGLLAKARIALEKGDVAGAEKLITQAEAANIRYPLIHMGDTPATLRRELVRTQTRLKNQQGGSGAALP